MAKEIGLEINNITRAIEAIQKAPSIMLRNIALSTREALQDIQDEATMNHPGFTSRSHTLERSIKVETEIKGQEVFGSVFLDESEAPYGPFQHEGTGIHGPSGQYIKIYPVKYEWLRWIGKNGKFAYAKKVINNPGVKGDPFLYNAADSRIQQVNQIFNRGVERGIEEAGL